MFLDCDGILLFDTLEDIVDKQLVKQKEFIWKSVKEEEKKNDKLWKELCKFSNNSNSNSNDSSHGETGELILRQDEIDHGIVPLKSRYDLHLINVGISTHTADKEQINYDLFNEHNNNIYLTQCMLS